jgi:restriction system protein|tara:strand:+ start:201 stop:443 length:243 start_codon:yes stop_codon:yes gene_type:complete
MVDFFEICSLLPWWFGVSVAVISYFIYHHYAVAEVINNGNMGQFAADNILKSFSAITQYLIPVFCRGGSLVSLLKRKNRQ